MSAVINTTLVNPIALPSVFRKQKKDSGELVGGNGHQLDQAGSLKPGELTGASNDSLFNSKAWVRTIEQTYGFEVKTQSTISENGNNAQIQYCDISDIRGRRIVSLPFSDYCDPTVENFKDWDTLVTPLLNSGVPMQFKTVFNSIPSQDKRFNSHICALWHGVDLTQPESILMDQMKDTARRNIRKAQKNNITIRQGNSLADVEIFYKMHCHVRKTKYRLLAQPFAFFENLHANFAPDNSVKILFAELNGVAIAGIFFLIHGDTLYYKFNASTDTESRPNDLLAWSGILMGQQMGLTKLDFGLSDISQPGLIAYKQKFATEEREITLHKWQPVGYSSVTEVNELLSNLTQLLTEHVVPDSVALASSNLLYKMFC
jgi:type III secretion system FlhB-like substrate exporter